MKVVFYSTKCPKCHVLEVKLKQKNIDYEECNDVELMLSKNIKSAPYLEVDGKLMDFSESINYLKELQ